MTIDLNKKVKNKEVKIFIFHGINFIGL